MLSFLQNFCTEVDIEVICIKMSKMSLELASDSTLIKKKKLVFSRSVSSKINGEITYLIHN